MDKQLHEDIAAHPYPLGTVNQAIVDAIHRLHSRLDNLSMVSAPSEPEKTDDPDNS